MVHRLEESTALFREFVGIRPFLVLQKPSGKA
jgi:hypothetical protein